MEQPYERWETTAVAVIHNELHHVSLDHFSS